VVTAAGTYKVTLTGFGRGQQSPPFYSVNQLRNQSRNQLTLNRKQLTINKKQLTHKLRECSDLNPGADRQCLYHQQCGGHGGKGMSSQLTALDLISILSFALGLENLQENRAQSAHNDVQAANQNQAAYLLEELGRKFDEQDEILTRILEEVEK
jgi:hypothetical protein